MLNTRREEACKKLFSDIFNNTGHQLIHLQSPKQESFYNLRQAHTFVHLITNTDGFSNTFFLPRV